MSYSAFELSADAGCPVELYEFRVGGTTEIYRHTSTDVAVEFLGEIFTPYFIERENINLDPSQSLTVNTDKNHPIAAKMIGFPNGALIHLTIRRFHSEDLLPVIAWRGRVKSAQFTDNRVKLICDPKRKSLKKAALRVSYSANCPYILYGAECGVNKDAFKVTKIITTAGTNFPIKPKEFHIPSDVTQPVFPDGYLRGGLVRRVLTDDWRMITDNAQESTFNTQFIYIIAPFQGLAAGETVELYPGCDLSLNTCKTKFNNLNNFGGFPFVPTKNPFSEDIN